LNITRWSHTNIYASSTSRPFELAAFGACIVSQPYNGLEKWFDFGSEVIVVNNETEAMETYSRLLSNENERTMMGSKAREHVMKKHTFRHRAKEFVTIANALK
jgi:spore maturation protein CgeB